MKQSKKIIGQDLTPDFKKELDDLFKNEPVQEPDFDDPDFDDYDHKEDFKKFYPKISFEHIIFLVFAGIYINTFIIIRKIK